MWFQTSTSLVVGLVTYDLFGVARHLSVTICACVIPMSLHYFMIWILQTGQSSMHSAIRVMYCTVRDANYIAAAARACDIDATDVYADARAL